ncbi:MAG TPA: monovalent cation:proton antiporter-2 (CPA2) family protein [Gammaproteobacteria bacterium]|nr:monovalent cation:proton antiporter-2 (CPA2) family protein [Gammaproteobacteria bacterium]
MIDALSQTIILLAISVVAVAIFRRFKLPPILAYLVVGCLLGPHASGLVADTEAIRFLAEVGVAFLLFSLGLEFSLPKLIANRRAVLLLGSAQVTLTIIIAALITWFTGAALITAFVVGCVLSLSSTAIVIKQLAERLELDSRHGQLSVAVLLFQDIAVIPMLVIIPTLAGNHSDSLFLSLGFRLTEGILVSMIMLAVGHWLLRPLFHEIASSHSAELFTLAVLLIALTSAWVTHHAGLSMALGAFMAGMMLSETEFRHQIEADIRPFRDVLLGLFFITIGMLLDLNNLLPMLHWVILTTIGIVVGKTLVIMTLSQLIMRAERGVALRTGMVLAQGGEFGFALLSLALLDGLMDISFSQHVLAAVILSMMLTPFLIRYNGLIAKRLFPGSYGLNREQIREDIRHRADKLNHHLIICGFGKIGQNIARLIAQENFGYIALDYNINLIRAAHKAGYKVLFGDSTRKDILHAAGIERAAALIICHDDIATTEKTLLQARKINPELPILVRTQDESYYELLQKAGATEIVPETLEASLIMASQILSIMGMPMARIVRRVQELRTTNYSHLRQFFQSGNQFDLHKPEASRKHLTSIVLPKNAYAVGKTVQELNLGKFNVNLHSNLRSHDSSAIHHTETPLKAGDTMVLFGTSEDLEHAEAYLLNG